MNLRHFFFCCCFSHDSPWIRPLRSNQHNHTHLNLIDSCDEFTLFGPTNTASNISIFTLFTKLQAQTLYYFRWLWWWIHPLWSNQHSFKHLNIHTLYKIQAQTLYYFIIFSMTFVVNSSSLVQTTHKHISNIHTLKKKNTISKIYVLFSWYSIDSCGELIPFGPNNTQTHIKYSHTLKPTSASQTLHY